MSQEITKQQNLPSSLTEAIQMGKVFFESGLFTDLKSAAQAVVKIQAGAELGIPPFAALSGVHIIQGKPTIGANLMAGRIKASGKYNYRVVQQDEKACSIDFYEGKEKIGNSTFTMEDAKKADTKNIGKFPRNMLFARAISNGVRWYCPDVFTTAVYTPEEMNLSVITEDIPHEEVKPVASVRKPVSDKGFASLIKKLEDANALPGDERFEAIAKIVDSASANLALTDDQASEFTKKVSELQAAV